MENKAFVKRIATVGRDTVKQMTDSHLLVTASSLAYMTTLSIVPLLAVSLALFQAFGGLEKLYGVIEPFILQNLAESTGKEAIQTLRGMINRIHAGALGASGLGALVVTCTLMLSSVEKAINRVWQVKSSRPFLYRFSLYWLIITLGPIALAIALGSFGSDHLSLSGFFPIGTGTWIIASTLLFFIYKTVPHRHVHWIPALSAALIAALIWSLARWGYGFYTTQIVSYNHLYGSLAAIPILLIWIYITWTIILGGTAFAAAFQKRFDLK